MTDEERIEAARKCYVAECLDPIHPATVGRMLLAAYPELHSWTGTPPTHWLAPWEASEEMRKAGEYAETSTSWGGENTFDYVSEQNAADIYAAMRTAYLAKDQE